MLQFSSTGTLWRWCSYVWVRFDTGKLENAAVCQELYSKIQEISLSSLQTWQTESYMQTAERARLTAGATWGKPESWRRCLSAPKIWVPEAISREEHNKLPGFCPRVKEETRSELMPTVISTHPPEEALLPQNAGGLFYGLGPLTSLVALAKLRATLRTGGARCMVVGFWKIISTLMACIIGF